MNEKPVSPFAEVERTSRFRVSFLTFLLVFVIVAVMSTSLLYASRSAMIRREVLAVFGLSSDLDADQESRSFHLAFLLFCYSAPLMLTGIMGLGRKAWVWWDDRRRAGREEEEEPLWGPPKVDEVKQTVHSSFRISKHGLD